MDWETFIIELLGKIAWPATTIVLGFTFRTPISQAVDRMRKLKKGDTEIEFSEVPRLDRGEHRALPLPKTTEEPKKPEAEKEAAKQPQPTPIQEPSIPPAAEPALVDYAPDGAIVNAWARLEDAMRRESQRLELLNAGEGPRRLVENLRTVGAFDDLSADAAIQLLQLRHRIVHDSTKASVDAAEQFVETVDELIARLEQNSDHVRLGQLLRELCAEGPGAVTVGLLPASGIGATEELARATAKRRLRQWVASTEEVIKIISVRDAALLLNEGARREAAAPIT